MQNQARAAATSTAAAPQGEEVVVTGSRSSEKVLDAPVAIEVIDGEDAATTGASAYLAALSNVKGLDFADTGINEKRISARGFNNQFNSRMLSMVDGRVASLPGNGLPQAGLLPTNSLDIKGIEVVMGPASALYGPNAHTGVVNVLTKSPWDQSGVALALRGGNQFLLDGSLRAAGTILDDFGWKLTGQYLRAEDFAPEENSLPHYYGTPAAGELVFEGDMVEHYDVRSIKAEGFLYWRGGDVNVKGGYGFSLNDGFSLTNAGRNHLRGWQVHHQTLSLSHPNWFAQVSRTAGSAGDSYQLDRLGSVVQTMGGPPVDPRELDPIRDQIKFIDKSQALDAELQYHDEFFGLKLTTGLQGRVYLPDSDGTYLADAAEKITATELGGYLQLDYELLDLLRFVGAARVDVHSNYSPQVSPKAALVYSIADSHNVRAGYNRAFKSPTILENYLLINNILRGNRNGYEIRDADGNVLSAIDGLSPERVDSVEIGYKGAISSVYIDVVAYYSWYENFISPLTQRSNPAMGTFAYDSEGAIVAAGTPAEGTLFTYANFGRAQVLGGDIGVDWFVIPEIELSAGVSLIKLIDFEAEQDQQALLLNVPEFKLKGSIEIRDLFVDNYFIKVSGRWQSPYEFASGRWISANYFDDGKVPGRFVMDIGFGYELPHGLSLSGHVFNVTNDKHVDVLGSPIIGPLAFLQVSYNYEGLDY